jgi:hypothetical protein
MDIKKENVHVVDSSVSAQGPEDVLFVKRVMNIQV